MIGIIILIKNLMIVQIINESNNDLPSYAKEGDSGMDLRADLTNVKNDFLFSAEYNEVDKTLTILPGGRALVPINIKTSIPPYQEFQIRSRSGLAIKHGIFVLNSPGTIDAKLKF
jgi:dUTP pyrophosphatase